MYFEVSNPDCVAKIDAALEKIKAFDEKLYSLEKKYGANTSYVFNSIDRGLEFSYLWFENYPLHLDLEKCFKIAQVKYKTGYEIRPRKSNKEFYNDFMGNMVGVNYDQLKSVLFGKEKCRPSMSYVKINDCYYIESDHDLFVAYRELTASEYKKLISGDNLSD